MTYSNQTFDEERALYGIRGAIVENCRFDGPNDGESAMKESSDINVKKCFFNLRYPFWHVNGADISDCTMTDKCRAPLWYDNDIGIYGCKINGVKALRECRNVTLKNTVVSSTEFIWKCRNIQAENLTVESDEYPFFEVEDMKIKHMKLSGKYSFQYCTNIKISDSELDEDKLYI